MIFQHTHRLITAGKKIQTLRLAYAGDELLTDRHGNAAVLEASFLRFGKPFRRIRWRVGTIYAVQPERCAKALCHVRCTYLKEVLHPLEVDEVFALREGFPSIDAWRTAWTSLHSKNPDQRCWSIGFTVMVTCGEILGPATKPGGRTVHYRRPIGHPMIAEALRTPGYSVRRAFVQADLFGVDGGLR